MRRIIAAAGAVAIGAALAAPAVALETPGPRDSYVVIMEADPLVREVGQDNLDTKKATRLDKKLKNSHRKALEAQREKRFDDEILPVETSLTGPDADGQPVERPVTFVRDEGPRADTSPEALARLREQFDALTDPARIQPRVPSCGPRADENTRCEATRA